MPTIRAFEVHQATAMDHALTPEWRQVFTSDNLDTCKEYIKKHRQDWVLFDIRANVERYWDLIQWTEKST